jgi:site-specific recombinase XerD
MEHTNLQSKIPYKSDFIIYLKANSYSVKTVRNYDRDLAYFEAFLNYSHIAFESLKKLHITLYKSILRTDEHIKLLPLVDQYWLSSNSNAPKPENSSHLAKTEELEPSTGTNSQLENSKPSKGSTAPNAENANDYKLELDVQTPNYAYSEFNGGTMKLLSINTINRMLSALRTYIKYLEEFDNVPPITSDNIKLLKKEKKETQVAEYDEIIKLIEFPSEFEKKKEIALRNRAILEILFSTGMRISEVVSLNREQLTLGKDSKDSPVQVSRIYITGKGKKQRFVYLTPRAKEHLIEYLNVRKDEYEPLFIQYVAKLKSETVKKNKKAKISKINLTQLKSRKSYRISIDYIQKKIIQYRKILGIIVPTTAHSLRHGFATYLIEKGANTAAVQILLGHESLATTTRYVHASDKFAEKTHKEFHPTQV